MTNEWPCFTHLSNRELLEEVQALAACERKATARLIASLMELDSRRLYLGEGCSSLFTYCTQVLHLSEHAAYGRIEAARAARRFPIVLERLADGSMTLTTVCLLAAHLTPENQHDVLAAARHKSKREVEQLVASLRPMPPVASVVRKLPSTPLVAGRQEIPASDGAPGPVVLHAPVPPARPTVVRPLTLETYKIQFTMSREMHDRLREAQDLMRHVVPNGDPSAIFDRALTLLLEDLHKARHAATARPRALSDIDDTSRQVAAKIKREVWARDGGQCAFIGANGRCAERGFLEYHHVVPYAAGGRTTAANLSLRCRAHNHHEAELFFGPLMVKETPGEWVVTHPGPGRVERTPRKVGERAGGYTRGRGSRHGGRRTRRRGVRPSDAILCKQRRRRLAPKHLRFLASSIHGSPRLASETPWPRQLAVARRRWKSSIHPKTAEKSRTGRGTDIA
jgi:hypothetical protein